MLKLLFCVTQYVTERVFIFIAVFHSIIKGGLQGTCLELFGANVTVHRLFWEHTILKLINTLFT